MQIPDRKKVLVAMSGGVDSSVAAALLKEQGYDVGGATIRTWASNECADVNTRACCGLTGVEDSRQVCEELDIPYWVFNFEKEFKEYVVDYFAREYQQGRTPNPCIACNEHIKFRLFLKRARKLGFEMIATGHYARLETDAETGMISLREGRDGHKDQSYVLFPLDQEVLGNLLLPIGGYTKSEIRELARQQGLCVMNKPESQEICFIPSNDYGAFLDREYVGKETAVDFQKPEGQAVIRMRDGQVLGEHKGYYHFTIGQRRGLGIPHSERLYVLDILPESNEVVVGTKEDVLDRRFWVDRMNWFSDPNIGDEYEAHVKIRSQHSKSPATIQVLSRDRIEVFFHHPQEAITPGQGAVVYTDDQVVGGGWIELTD